MVYPKNKICYRRIIRYVPGMYEYFLPVSVESVGVRADPVWWSRAHAEDGGISFVREREIKVSSGTLWT